MHKLPVYFHQFNYFIKNFLAFFHLDVNASSLSTNVSLCNSAVTANKTLLPTHPTYR